MDIAKQIIFDIFNYVPHEGQLQVHNSRARHRFVSGGAQGGKTELATMEALAGMLHPPKKKFDDIRAWLIGPQYKQVDKIFSRGVHKKLAQSEFRNDFTINKADRKIEFYDGSWIQGRSAEKPSDLAAEELDFCIVDEGPRCKEETIDYLRTRLITRQGWLLSIGTPIGRNWYHAEYLKGLTGDDPDIQSFNMPTFMNPYIATSEIQKLKQRMTERWYRQEILGEFVEDASSVFVNVKDIVDQWLTCGIKKPHPHVIGLDLGRFNDYTVAIAFNCYLREVAGYLRIQGDWLPQTEKIERFCNYWGGPVLVDATTGVSAGSYMHEILSQKGIYTIPINIDRLMKETLIGRLQTAIMDKSIKIPDLKILIAELEAFQYMRKRNSLTVQMRAPHGMHDDFVIALALALHGYSTYSGSLDFIVR
jgi:hypothetical protein